MGLFNQFTSLATSEDFADFRSACHDPEASEALGWARLQKLFSRGSFWSTDRIDIKKRDLSSFSLSSYEFYETGIKEAIRTGCSPFTGEKVLFLNFSMMDPSRVFLYTKSVREEFFRVQKSFLHGLTRRYSGFMEQPVLFISEPDPHHRISSQLDSGPVSLYNYRNLPALAATRYSLPAEILRSREIFFDWGPVYALQDDHSAVFCNDSSLFSEFFSCYEAGPEQILARISGEIPLPDGLPPLQCGPERRKKVSELLEKGEPDLFSQLWPGLGFICQPLHSMTEKAKVLLSRFFSETPLIDNIYMGEEGWFNVPRGDDTAGSPLHHKGNLLEFLPLSRQPAAEDLIRSLDLTVGQSYELVITNARGFIRLRTGRKVKCISFVEKSPVIVRDTD